VISPEQDQIDAELIRHLDRIDGYSELARDLAAAR